MNVLHVRCLLKQTSGSGSLVFVPAAVLHVCRCDSTDAGNSGTLYPAYLAGIVGTGAKEGLWGGGWR